MLHTPNQELLKCILVVLVPIHKRICDFFLRTYVRYYLYFFKYNYVPLFFVLKIVFIFAVWVLKTSLKYAWPNCCNQIKLRSNKLHAPTISVPSLKFRYSVKVTNLKEISHFVLTLLSNSIKVGYFQILRPSHNI